MLRFAGRTMHRLSRRSAVSCLLHANIGLVHRTTAAAAQASVLSQLTSPGVEERDVSSRWYSAVSGGGSVNEAPPKKDDTLLLGKLYESAGVESKEPTPPILLRDPKELTRHNYNEFYKKTFNEDLEPLTSCHFTEYRVNGDVQFRCILYIPNVYDVGMFDDIVTPGTKNVRLYVKGVLFSDDFGGQLLPSYLSFVKGVVDCNCFPLDVSNQYLQESRIVLILRKWLLHKTFVMIGQLSSLEYQCFLQKYGTIMKSGCIEDRRNHSILAPLLLHFYSSDSERGVINLNAYVENMRCDQKYIYYVVSDCGRDARNLPIVKRFAEKGVEVLIVCNPSDEAIIQGLKFYKGKNVLDISKED